MRRMKRVLGGTLELKLTTVIDWFWISLPGTFVRMFVVTIMRIWIRMMRMGLETVMMTGRRYFMILICLVMMSFIVAEQESDVD